jgi:hypothetical protein
VVEGKTKDKRKKIKDWAFPLFPFSPPLGKTSFAESDRLFSVLRPPTDFFLFTFVFYLIQPHFSYAMRYTPGALPYTTLPFWQTFLAPKSANPKHPLFQGLNKQITSM